MFINRVKKSCLVRKLHNKILRPRWKYDFVSRLHDGARLLDVGCGNDSPYRYKTIRPLIHYTGLDIGDYRQTKPNLADEYILCAPDKFTSQISKRRGQFDAVLSSHNLEHCIDRIGTVDAMADALKPNGVLYLAFPSSASATFPAREGTLNYFDDLTHLDSPPDFDEIISKLKSKGLIVEFANRRYRPVLLKLVGRFMERRSKAIHHVLTGTWEFWGFEAIIWARKPTT